VVVPEVTSKVPPAAFRTMALPVPIVRVAVVCRVPPPNVMSLAVLPRLLSLLMLIAPALIVIGVPEKVFVPLNVRVPAPVLVMAPAPDMIPAALVAAPILNVTVPALKVISLPEPIVVTPVVWNVVPLANVKSLAVLPRLLSAATLKVPALTLMGDPVKLPEDVNARVPAPVLFKVPDPIIEPSTVVVPVVTSNVLLALLILTDVAPRLKVAVVCNVALPMLRAVTLLRLLPLEMLRVPPSIITSEVNVLTPPKIRVPVFCFLNIADVLPEITPFKVSVVPEATSKTLLEAIPVKAIFLLVVRLAVVNKVPVLKLIELAALPRFASLEILKRPSRMMGEPLNVLVPVRTTLLKVLVIVNWPVPDITPCMVSGEEN